jgi:aryl-alcohol dehydrogenase-like predicted oxidoreductase
MQKRTLGSSNLEVSAVGLGCMAHAFDPGLGVLVLVVARVAKDFEGAVIAVDAAAILRRARTLA